ncbi:hypothetical protein G4B88_005302 [Cannabis sativa]|uniref:Uncharacterized protein n=1 Tax=Cannabis sativa TaxID=3483 RepID=A0A7J6HAL1_CANSA|nr:hypothetical protein G4B88_005302 [Cannabis sativa]
MGAPDPIQLEQSPAFIRGELNPLLCSIAYPSLKRLGKKIIKNKPRFSTTVTGPGRRDSSKPSGKCSVSAKRLISNTSPTHIARGLFEGKMSGEHTKHHKRIHRGYQWAQQ